MNTLLLNKDRIVSKKTASDIPSLDNPEQTSLEVRLVTWLCFTWLRTVNFGAAIWLSLKYHVAFGSSFPSRAVVV